MAALEIIFWLSLFAIFYAYLGYPACLCLIGLFRTEPVKKDSIRPSVSLVISVYNEENILPRRIQNALDLEYPKDLFEIAIISDGSTDRTNDIIRKYAEQDSRILPCIISNNKGKTACLNDFIPALRGEIVLFSDANSFYEAGLIRKIVEPFATQRIGFVTGSTRYFSSVNGKHIKATNLYSTLERWTKKLESRIGSCVGADGAVFAIRKVLFSPMDPSDINDLVIPLQIVRKGYRGVLEVTALCEEDVAGGVKSEFRRQARITCRSIRAIFHYRCLLNPFRYPVFSFELFTHKLMRFMTPFWTLLILITNIILAFKSHWFYKSTLMVQLLFYLLALAEMAGQVDTSRNPLTRICRAYACVTAAYALGWFKYLSGETYTSWSPDR